MTAMQRSSTILLGMSLALTLAFTGGCERTKPAPPPHADDALRIISLSPAISRTLVDLGVDDAIVGRTPFCESIDQAIPVVGDLHDLDYERLLRVRPTHLLVQPQASGMDSRLLELAEDNQWFIGAWRLNDMADVQTMLGELPETLGRNDLIARAVELHIMIDEALQPASEQWTGRVLLVAGLNPVGAFGTGTYLHDVLTSLGASNALTLANYPQLTLEDITRLNPQAIILVRPGADHDTDAFAAAGSLARLQIDAVADGRIGVLTHPDAFMPSTGIIGVAAEMRTLLETFNLSLQESAP